MNRFPMFEQLRERIAASATSQRIWTYYESAAPREQLAMQVGTAAVLMLLVWLLIVAPMHVWSRDARADYVQQRDTLAWMEANRHRVGGTTTSSERAAGESLLTLANRTAANHDISFRRYEPVGTDSLSVTLEATPFNAVVQWLGEMERSGVFASELSVRRRDEPGLVDARIVIGE